MSEISLQKLVESLPKGYSTIIANRLHISRKTVYKVISDGNMGHPVIEEMVKLAEEHKAKMIELQDRIKNVAS